MNWTDQLADWAFTAKLKMDGFRTVYPEAHGDANPCIRAVFVDQIEIYRK